MRSRWGLRVNLSPKMAPQMIQGRVRALRGPVGSRLQGVSPSGDPAWVRVHLREGPRNNEPNLCKRTVSGALVDDCTATALARHATAVRRDCYWTATGPQRHCHGNAAAPTRHCHGTGTPPHILCKWSEEGTDGNDENDGSVVYPTKQLGPQPLPPSAGGAHVIHCILCSMYSTVY